MKSEKMPAAMAILHATALFHELTEGELSALASSAVLRRFAAGELLFSEGDSCKALHVIAAGRVRVFNRGADGRERILAEETAGESVAELPVFDGGPYPASCVAVENSQVLMLSRRDFKGCCTENPDVALKLLEVMARRMRHLVGIVHELSFSTLRQRLIAWILREADARGRPGPDGIALELGITRQELAAHIGTVRELISRNLAALESEGLLQTQGRAIIIRDRARMARELPASNEHGHHEMLDFKGIQ